MSSSSRSAPSPVGEAGGGMANAIIGHAHHVRTRRPVGRADWRHERNLCRRVSGSRFASSRPLRCRHAQRRPVDRHRRVRLRDRRPAVQKFSALAGSLALGIMMIPIITRTTEELLRAGADVHARGRARAWRDAGPRRVHGRASGGPAGHRHRRRPGSRPDRRRNGAAALHRTQQSLLVHRPDRADGLAHRSDVHLCHRAVRRLASPGVGRRAGPRGARS